MQQQPQNEIFQTSYGITPKKRSGLWVGVFSAVLLALVATGIFFRQDIIDQLTVWRFTPSADLQSIALRASFSEQGKHYLYMSETQVVDRDGFNEKCGTLQNEKTVVLGCYTVPDRRIYVYNVSDTRLDGVKEATAAHEMLHAAYDRLSNSERTRINGLLKDQEQKITDPRLLELIKSYSLAEPTELDNELHSIFGTEIRDLSPELEIYYGQYFTDRLTVVGFKEKYEKVFTDLRVRQEQLVVELNSLVTTINNLRADYTVKLEKINSDIEALNTWAKSGDATQSAFDLRRAELLKRISALDADRARINDDIKTYDSKKVELDELNLQSENLNQSIDSNLASPKSL